MWFLVVFSIASLFYASCETELSGPEIHFDIYKNTLPESQQSARVVGGSYAQRYQFIYQVSIRYAGSSSQYQHICGGSLIHPRVVLTAAHCKLDKGKYEIAAGMLDRNEFHSDVQYAKVEEFIIHKQFSGGVGKFDIGVLILKDPVVLNKAVGVIPLPDQQECDHIDRRLLSGWGLTQSAVPILSPIRLRYALLPQITYKECSTKLARLNNNSSAPLDEETMICTGADEGRWQSACNGDSGGPLAHKNKSSVVGIVSWGLFPCGMNDAPTVYTKVCSYLSWIQEQAGGHL